MLLEIGLILLLIAVNGFFAGAEMAVIAVRPSRLQQLVEERRSGARAVQALRADPERFLATVQIGITVVGAAAAAFSGATVAARLAPLLAPLPWVGPLAEDLALVLVVVGVSYLSLVLGELVPKSLALRAGEAYALRAGRPLQALAWLAGPVVRLLTATSNVLLRPFGDSTSFTESRMSREELSQVVEDAAEAGSLSERGGELASRALEFGTLCAADVMVPRGQVVALPRHAGPEELRRTMLEQGHDRVPVFAESLDGIAGYVTASDVLGELLTRGRLALPEVLRPVLFTPESANAERLLHDLQRKGLWLAVVVDEHGGVAGVVTLQDLLSELVGDLFPEKATPQPTIVREPDGAALVRGHVPVRDVNRALDLALPEGEEWTTVAGLCIAHAGAIPEAGAKLTIGEVELEVVEASRRQVKLIRVRPLPKAGEIG